MKKTLLAALLTVGSCATAQAQQGVSWTSYQFSSAGGAPITIGYRFDVTAPVTVIGLGFFTDPNKGVVAPDFTLGDSHEVGLWSVIGGVHTLLETTVVTNSSTLIGMFKYNLTKPISLGVTGSNDYYEVAGFTSDDGWAYGDSFDPSPTGTSNFNGYAVAPGLSNALGWYTYASGFTEPLGTAHEMYGGGNVLLGAVPEPAPLAVLGLGALGLLLRRRRK